MKQVIYTADKDNILQNLNNTYGSSKSVRIYMANNIKRLNIVQSGNTNSQHVKHVKIGNNAQIIGDNCFCGYTELTSVTGGNSVYKIGDQAFLGCTSIVSTPIMDHGMTYIGTQAFKNCTSLRTGLIYKSGSSYPSIGNNTYYGCTSMTSAYIEGTCSQGMFQGCTSLKECTFATVLSVDQNTFYGCTSLTKINNGGTTAACTGINIATSPGVGSQSFYNCTSIPNVLASGCRSIGSQAFYNCTSMTDFTVGNSLTSIEVNAFQNCTALTSINLQNSSITQLNNIISNTGIRSLNLPSTITTHEQLVTNCLQNTSVTNIHFYGMTDAYIKANKDKNWKFGGTNVVTIQSSTNKTYKVKADGTILFGKIMCIIHTAINTGLVYGCKYNISLMYSMVSQMNTDNDMIDYFLMGDEAYDLPSGKTLENSTKANIFAHIDAALAEDSEYTTLIMYLADRGSGSYIRVWNSEKIYGTEIATHVKAGSPDKRIFFICDCCHSEGMAPFAAKNSSKSRQILQNDNEDIIDAIFKEFDRKPVKLKNGLLGDSVAETNPNPTFLAWYTCDVNNYGWMGSKGMYFLLRIKDVFNKDSTKTYASMWSQIGAVPYSYTYIRDKQESYYGYGSSKGKSQAYHKKRNYQNRFDESASVFT